MSARTCGHSTSRLRRAARSSPSAPANQKRSGCPQPVERVHLAADKSLKERRAVGRCLGVGRDRAARPRTARARTSSSRHTARPTRRRCRSSAGRAARGARSVRAGSGWRSGGRSCSAGSRERRWRLGGMPRVYGARPEASAFVATRAEVARPATSAGTTIDPRWLTERARASSVSRADDGRLEVLLAHPGGPYLRGTRPRRLDDPEGRTGRRLRAARRGRSARVRGGDRHPDRLDGCRPSRSARSSRRAARSSTPGRSRATWTRTRRCRTRSRWSGRRGRDDARCSPRSTGSAGSIRTRRGAGSRPARSRSSTDSRRPSPSDRRRET